MDTEQRINRRGFVTVGAVLAAGSLALPRTALAAAPGLSAPPEGTTRLLDDLRAILDRPLAATAEVRTRCECAGCTAGRAAAFECLACGFTGEPVVLPCDCLRDWNEAVALWTGVVANWQGPTAHYPKSRRRYRRWLARVRRERPQVPCSDGVCAHLARTCPVCGAPEGDTGEEAFRLGAIENTGPAEMIRDLRAMVRAMAEA